MNLFLLMDLETTGLDPKRCKIIEVAARVLAPDRERGRYYSLVGAGESDYWETPAIVMHKASGLWGETLCCTKDIDEVDRELSARLLDVSREPYYLMGNSVHFDRAFIDAQMPLTRELLHHRQLDVTSVRLWWQLMSGVDPLAEEKNKAHRAQDDIDSTLKEATLYWQRR
jgi:oligoribonuclease